jgi:lipopolysaccharide transport system ATP-binding protein
MSNIAIRVDGLGKTYHIGGPQERYRTIRDTLSDAFVAPFRRARNLLRGQAYGAANLHETIWALKDISFEVKHGEVIGIIGRNGAGKSTLLKILSRITEPTEGYIDIYGRVGALLEVGTGFHPELTGRENIYLNGAILGMSRAEIDRKFDEIVAFAEVEKFIDTPVKHYSSGMGLRLGFSVAAHLEPEILVVDEVLAVGDAAFQQKCLGKMSSVAQEGRTVLFVSHNMAAVENLCQRLILLESGRLVLSGMPQSVIERYIESSKMMTYTPLIERSDRIGNGSIRFTEVVYRNTAGKQVDTISCGEDIQIELGYETFDGEAPRKISVSLTLVTSQGENVACLWDQASERQLPDTMPARGWLVCSVNHFPLMPGKYFLQLTITNGGQLADRIANAAVLNVIDGDFFGAGRLPPANLGKFLILHSWFLETPQPVEP